MLRFFDADIFSHSYMHTHYIMLSVQRPEMKIMNILYRFITGKNSAYLFFQMGIGYALQHNAQSRLQVAIDIEQYKKGYPQRQQRVQNRYLKKIHHHRTY